MIDLDAKALDLDLLIDNQKEMKKTPEIEEKQEKTFLKKQEKQNKDYEKIKSQKKIIQKKTIEEKKSNLEINNEKNTETNKLEKKESIIDNRLIIGQNEKHNDFYISDNCRNLNLAIIGNKGTGKTTNLLPFFAEQDISKKLSGVTFIVNDKEIAYAIYSLCKKYKRKVHLLKPTTNNEISNNFLWKKEYDYDYINEKIINYKEVIRRKEIVIIDMEIFKYKMDAIRATEMLLIQLRLDLSDTDITQRNEHFLYVDDAIYYMRFLDDFLKHGNTYHLSSILFLDSRSQLLHNNIYCCDLLDDYVRNYILLNKLTVDDYRYYKELFPEKIFENIKNKEKTSLTFQTVDQKGMIRTGIAKIKQLNNIDMEELEKKSKKVRTALLKEKRKERENEIRSNMENSQFSNEPKPIDEALLKTLINELDPENESYSQTEIDENNKIIEEKIQEKIREEEKSTKRQAAENIYNHYDNNIQFCDDLFKFD